MDGNIGGLPDKTKVLRTQIRNSADQFIIVSPINIYRMIQHIGHPDLTLVHCHISGFKTFGFSKSMQVFQLRVKDHNLLTIGICHKEISPFIHITIDGQFQLALTSRYKVLKVSKGQIQHNQSAQSGITYIYLLLMGSDPIRLNHIQRGLFSK